MASKQREFLKAQALRDFDKADELDAQLTDAERGEYYLLSLALFAGALGHRLGDDPTREEIDTSARRETRQATTGGDGRDSDFLQSQGGIY